MEFQFDLSRQSSQLELGFDMAEAAVMVSLGHTHPEKKFKRKALSQK